MVPAILILTLAWTLKSMTDSLGAAEYVSGIVANSAAGLQQLLPAMIFIVAAFWRSPQARRGEHSAY